MNKEQSAAVAGGLQSHSVGGIYPYAVVGYANGSDVKYRLENIQDGTVFAHRWTGLPVEWDSAAGPIKVGLHFASGKGTGILYEFGPPPSKPIGREPAERGPDVSPREAYYTATEMEPVHV